MHDIRAIRADAAAFDAALARRGIEPLADSLLVLGADRRTCLTALQDKQAHRNALSKQVGHMRRTGADTSALEAEAGALRTEMESLEVRVATLDADIKAVVES